jgi:cytochrome c2
VRRPVLDQCASGLGRSWKCTTSGLDAVSGVVPGAPAAGASAFVRQCAICHTIEKGEPNRFGPNLSGIVGKKAAAVPGFDYSRAFKSTAIGNGERTRSEAGSCFPA